MSLNNQFRLDDKITVVTGGAGLIGSAICSALSEAGAKVYIAEVNSEKALNLKNNIISKGFDAEFVELDITSEQSIESAIANIIKKDKKIDIWINNAYPRTSDWGDKFEDIKPQSFRKNVDMHMNGYFFCCQSVLKEMRKTESGVIINIGSHYGVLGPNFSIYEGTKMTMPAAYSLIKGGIVNFTRYLATYYGQHNIRVNAVCPGGIFDNQDPIFVEKYNKLTPLNRMGNPNEIAGPVLFLCSDLASYITGQVIMVDGGLSAW
ncbi:short-chain dehydrogenase/reductase SDR [Candidatus Magnetoovum chiemensis]|nr:short-chain dehydrogenase/reductase SDR [Candidatus Magnetoovum chiemensis]